MGQQSVNKEIIDETFSGLLDPKEVHEMGRDDIGSDKRPGAILLSAVRSFGREGFQNIAKEREDQRNAVEADASVQTKSELANFGLRSADGTDAPEHNISKSED